MKIKYFVSALLMSFCLFFLSPLDVFANYSITVDDISFRSFPDFYLPCVNVSSWKSASSLEYFYAYYQGQLTGTSLCLSGEANMYASGWATFESTFTFSPFYENESNFLSYNSVNVNVSSNTENVDVFLRSINCPTNDSVVVQYSVNLLDLPRLNNDLFWIDLVFDFEIVYASPPSGTAGVSSSIIPKSYKVTESHVAKQSYLTSFNDLSDGKSLFSGLARKFDEQKDNILNGFDSSTGDQANTNFSNSTADLEAAEGSLFENTSYNQVDYNQFDSFFSLESVGGAILFVKSALEAMYSSLGIFGIPISIGLVLLVFTRLIGFQNFTSGGG